MYIHVLHLKEAVRLILSNLICAMPFVYVINFWLSEMGEKIRVKERVPLSLFRGNTGLVYEV